MSYKLGPPVDFDLPDLILRVLEAWELGKRGLYRKYWSYKKIMKISKFYFGSGNPKKRFLRFFQIFLTRKIRNTGISSETTIPGISSEPTETQEPRVRRRKPDFQGPKLALQRSYVEDPSRDT